jgi:hypothetical protein
LTPVVPPVRIAGRIKNREPFGFTAEKGEELSVSCHPALRSLSQSSKRFASPLCPFANELLIANDGVAVEQVIDPYCFWQLATTPAGEAKNDTLCREVA